MKVYCLEFSMPAFGTVFVEAETDEEAMGTAKDIANGDLDFPIDWSLDFYQEGPLSIVNVEFVEEVKENPEQTDEEWFNNWQKELYADGYVD